MSTVEDLFFAEHLHWIIFDSLHLYINEMSFRLSNSAQQNQKLKASRRASVASTGVNYCLKCEERQLRRERKKKIAIPPPTNLFFYWYVAFFCLMFPTHSWVWLPVLSYFMMLEFISISKSFASQVAPTSTVLSCARVCGIVVTGELACNYWSDFIVPIFEYIVFHVNVATFLLVCYFTIAVLRIIVSHLHRQIEWLASLLMCLYYSDLFPDWFAIPTFERFVYCMTICGASLCSIYYVVKRIRNFMRPEILPQDSSPGPRPVDKLVKQTSQIYYLIEILNDCKSKRGMIAAIAQYLQSQVDESLPLYIYRVLTRSSCVSNWFSADATEKIEKMVTDAFNGTEDPHEDIEVSEDGSPTIIPHADGIDSDVPWLYAMDKAFGDWKAFRHSAMSKKFVNLINMIVTIGLCKTNDLTFSLGNVNLFTPVVSKQQHQAGDVFEVAYEAVSGFMKGGWRVFKTGEVSAFFKEDDKITEFERMYNEIRSIHGFALTGNLKEYANMEDNDYELLVPKAIKYGEALLLCVKRSQTFERKYINDRVERLRDYHTEFTQIRTRGGLRISPFSVSLFGQSGCGKSSLTNLTVSAGLRYNDLSAEKDRIASWADNDKFASAIRGHINAIIFDDFANTKETFMDFSPAYRLIQVINNIRYLAPMADVFLKGKVALNPYFCVVSTNIRHLNAGVYSNEPESVLRRLYHVTVIPKAEFCEKGILSKKLIEAKFGTVPTPDVWELTIHSYEAQNCRHVKMDAFVPIVFEGKKMEKISVHEYLRWVQLASKIHFSEERQYVSNQESVPVVCPTCKTFYCNCVKVSPDEMLQAHSADLQTIRAWIPAMPKFTRVSTFLSNRAKIIQDYYEEAQTSTVVAATQFCDYWNRLDFLPESMICHPKVLSCCLFFWREEIKQSLITGISVLFLAMIFLCNVLPYFCITWISLFFATSYWYFCATLQTYQLMAKERILSLKDVVRSYTSQWQAKHALIGLGALAATLGILRWKSAAYSEEKQKENMKQYELLPNSTLNPENFEEVQKRNDETNNWLKAETVPLPMAAPSKTTTAENLVASMRPNLVGLTSDVNKGTLGFFICSNVLIVPTHFITTHGERDILVHVLRNGKNGVGSVYRDKICPAYSVAVPGTDFTVCFMTNGGSFKNFSKFLPENNVMRACDAYFLTREMKGDQYWQLPTFFQGSSGVSHMYARFMGGYYKLPPKVDTRPGMCMSPLVSKLHGAMIIGFHLGGGITDSRVGACGILTRAELEAALTQLGGINGVVLSASSATIMPHMGDFPMETFGQPILTSTDIHPKSAVNFLEEGSNIDIYGSAPGKSTPSSRVTETIISDDVAEIFGVPQQWGPPKMKGKGRFPFQETLKYAAIPSLPIGSVLEKAVESMKSLTTSLVEKIPKMFDARPLTQVETVSGIDGKRFIDPMNFSTSPGFPFGGNKRPLLVDLPKDSVPGVSNPRTFIPAVWEEFEKTKKRLLSGERAYAIWKSCLKDEPTKLSKDKVRVFQSAPIVLQLLVRMYFLPIIRIIQLNPILYECAVGVNAEGLEWEELWESAMSKGKDRVLAGDYSKYDVRMPASATIAAFDILIDIAERCPGYSPEDILLMRMMVNEIVYPVLANNGDLIQLFGTNPSGQNLTVIINSLVNSLLLRSCFFTLFPDLDFKEHCSFLTYGDDVLGTVSEFCKQFSHLYYAAWLATLDMKFTMPDKTSEPTAFMSEKDVDFLQRKTDFNPDLGRKVGMLSESSIYKRLHSHLSSKEISPEMQSAQNIESSLHDWFYYGREVFNDRRAKLVQVAERNQILHLCPALDVLYDERVAKWRHKYLGEELPEVYKQEEIEIVPHCGDMYVGTYDYNDHCIGSYKDIFFAWEHWAAWCTKYAMFAAWYYIASNNLVVRPGKISKSFLFHLALVTGGYQQWKWFIFWYIFTWLELMLVPWVFWQYYGLYLYVTTGHFPGY